MKTPFSYCVAIFFVFFAVINFAAIYFDHEISNTNIFGLVALGFLALFNRGD